VLHGGEAVQDTLRHAEGETPPLK